jgi:hypothetical protein
LRLAMIDPPGAARRYNGPSRSPLSNASYQQIAAGAGAVAEVIRTQNQ